MLMQRIHQCEFCSVTFHPRPQVKKPRACGRPDCQRKRQRSNELAWRERNGTLSDPKYHRAQKQVRLKRLQQLAEVFSRCFKTGALFLNETLSSVPIQGLLLEFLLALGVRRINKVWPEAFVQALSGVA